MNTATKQKQYRGPVRYNHGTDSPYKLCVRSVEGVWVTRWSRARPGSRAKKEFSKDAQLAHLMRSFEEEQKGFEGMVGTADYAYVAEAAATSWEGALWLWDKSSRTWVKNTRQPNDLPNKPTKKWVFKQESRFFLHVKVQTGWLPKIYGWLAASEYEPPVFSEQEEVARLQAQLLAGGHEGNKFELASVVQAHVARCAGGHVGYAEAYYTPERGWYQGEAPLLPSTIEVPVLSTRLWVSYCNGTKSETIRMNAALAVRYGGFLRVMADSYAAYLNQYVDPETGEVHPLAIECLFWALIGQEKKHMNPACNNVRVYLDESNYLVVRIDGQGRFLYAKECLAAPTLAFFKKISA
jgi:hypothetical protein